MSEVQVRISSAWAGQDWRKTAGLWTSGRLGYEQVSAITDLRLLGGLVTSVSKEIFEYDEILDMARRRDLVNLASKRPARITGLTQLLVSAMFSDDDDRQHLAYDLTERKLARPPGAPEELWVLPDSALDVMWIPPATAQMQRPADGSLPAQ